MNKKVLPIPPGATIKEQMEWREMSLDEFADKMGMSKKQAAELIDGKTAITVYIAEKLESALMLPMVFWLRLEGIYRDKIIKSKGGETT